MKIKTVCELTGLSDRTIRYYIEQGLLSVSYTENYLGRKTYDFSYKDVYGLKDIALLRKFDFTVEEIKSIINDAESSKAILLDVKNRTEEIAADCQKKLEVLSQINAERTYSLSELADELSNPSLSLPARDEVIAPIIDRNTISLITIILFGIFLMPVAIKLFIGDDVSNIIKSIIVVIVVAFLAFVLVSNTLYMVKQAKSLERSGFIKRIVLAVITVLFIIMLLPYSIPFNINVSFEEIACVELESGTFEGQEDCWYTVYCVDYGFFEVTDDAYYKYPNIPPYKGEFAELDTSKYTYIYTFGAPLDEFYYNVWDCEGIPILDFGTSTKWGNAVLGISEENNKAYMYRISKKAIANEENTMRW